MDDRCRLFLYFLNDFEFSIFPKKVIGPDASESVLGRPWCFGRASWGIFGPSEGVRQGILGPPEGSGGHLGRSWAVLGRSWSDILSSSIFDRFFDRFWSPKGCPKEGIWGPKTVLKTTKNRSKDHVEKRSRFRSLLRPSWGDLGPILASSWDLRRVKIVLSPRAGLIF